MTDPRPYPSATEDTATPPEEAVHLPEPSVWPVTLALGFTLLAAGLVVHATFAVAGALLIILAAWGWVGELRRG